MNLDLLAGISRPLHAVTVSTPTILVFDSGLGGLTVFAEILRARPDARFVYAADDAGFPYGALSEDAVVRRVEAVMDRLIGRYAPDLVVIACNTASTLVLPHLRRRFEVPFVGTVPAIKPAAAASRSKRVSVLATPGTVARDYTRGLVEAYAGECRVELIGSRLLAEFAEAEMRGEGVPPEAIAAEIAPCFVRDDAGRTDVVVLACTHYPLLLARFREVAPWEVTWIDPAPAIARRVVQIVGPFQVRARSAPDDEAVAIFTAGADLDTGLMKVLSSRGLADVRVDPMPLPSPSALT